jgi:glucose dehydrogenase
VYTATVGYTIGTLGAIYAVDAASGRVVWRRSTIRGQLAHPAEAGGGGSWNPLSVDGSTVYAGTANPVPWGGTPQRPNGGAYAGASLYTDSLLALDAAGGGIRWYDQITPHDVRDYDFQASPVLVTAGGRDLVVGAGKAGRVVAWDRSTHGRVWQTPVGVHRNDLGPLPRRAVKVCPGLLGGVETDMAAADGRLFVPVVDLCYRENATGVAARSFQTTDPERGRGQLVALDLATGKQLWRRQLPSPDFGCATAGGDVVFTTTFDGTLYGFAADDGRELFRTRLRAGVNACPAVSGDLVIVAAGVKVKARPKPVFEVSAYGLP